MLLIKNEVRDTIIPSIHNEIIYTMKTLKTYVKGQCNNVGFINV